MSLRYVRKKVILRLMASLRNVRKGASTQLRKAAFYHKIESNKIEIMFKQEVFLQNGAGKESLWPSFVSISCIITTLSSKYPYIQLWNEKSQYSISLEIVDQPR